MIWPVCRKCGADERLVFVAGQPRTKCDKCPPPATVTTDNTRAVQKKGPPHAD